MLEQDAQRMWTRWNRALAADREYYANEDAKYNPGEDSDSDMSVGEKGAKPPKAPKRDEYAPAVVRQKDRTITGEFRISPNQTVARLQSN